MAPLLPTVEGPVFIPNGTVKVRNWDIEDKVAYKDQFWQWFELSYNIRKLKYTVSIFGSQPELGYPLFIGLHGGGEDKTGKGNDSSWYDASTRYFYEPLQKQVADSSANGAILIVPRGVSIRDPNMPKAKDDLIDTYDLHSQPESYVFWEQLVKNFLFMKDLRELGQEYAKYAGQLNAKATQLVNPDRIYLLGYSAGGDGAFQLGARMPDRFAAVNAGGGHPNWVKFDNMANLPICLQNGELDSGERRHWRARINVETDGILNKLYQDLGVIEEDYYRHECFIVKGRSHDDWHQPDEIESGQGVLSNLSAWYTNAGAIGARFMVSKDLNPLRWVSNYSRNPIPPLVIWNLGVRPPRLAGATEIASSIDKPGWQPKRFFYWVFMRDPKLDSTDIVRAEYKTKEISIRVSNPDPKLLSADNTIANLALLFTEYMVWFEQDIRVNVQGNPLAAPIKLSVNTKVREETLKARGDPHLQFSAVVYFEKTGDSWEAKTAQSLAAIDGTQLVKGKL